MHKVLESKIIEVMDELINAEEVLEREVVAVGNGAHINMPKKHLGKKVKVIIKKEGKNSTAKE